MKRRFSWNSDFPECRYLFLFFLFILTLGLAIGTAEVDRELGGKYENKFAQTRRRPFFCVATHSRCCFLLYRHTLTLVLRGEWPKLGKAPKTHLTVTLQRCLTQLGQHPATPRCTALLALVINPWTNPVLDSILNGQPDSEHEEGKKKRIIVVILI